MCSTARRTTSASLSRPGVPGAAGNERATFEKSHGLLLCWKHNDDRALTRSDECAGGEKVPAGIDMPAGNQQYQSGIAQAL